MSAAMQQLPTSIKVIGWTAIILSITLMFTGFFRFYVHEKTMARIESGYFGNMGYQNSSDLINAVDRVFEITRPISYVQIVLGIILLSSAILFMNLRKWARLVLEAFGWLFLAVLPLLATFSIFVWLSVFTNESLANQNSIIVFLKWLGPIITIFVSGILMAILLKAVRVLRGDKVRNAMLPA